MDYQQQVDEIVKIQKKIGDSALPILLGLKDADANLMVCGQVHLEQNI